MLDATKTLPPDDFLLFLFSPGEYMVGKLLSMFYCEAAIGKNILSRTYMGALDLHGFYYSAQDEDALLYYTTHGPYLPQWDYGEFVWDLGAPMPYVPEDDWHYWYIAIFPEISEKTDFYISANASFVGDIYEW